MTTTFIQEKPYYNVSKDADGLYGTISYGDKLYKLDIPDLFKIINHNRGFHFHQKDDIYPSFNANRIRTSYFDFLYRHSRESVSYVFQNDDKCDLRKRNVKMYHKYHNEIIKKYPDAIYFEGHYSLQGKDAYMMKNPYWKIDDDVFLMYCERDTLVKLDERSIKMILNIEKTQGRKLTFYKSTSPPTTSPPKFYS